jgi:hypothetical protein
MHTATNWHWSCVTAVYWVGQDTLEVLRLFLHLLHALESLVEHVVETALAAELRH